MTENQTAALHRLRRKLEVLKMDTAKEQNAKYYDLQECITLLNIIEKDTK